MISTILLSSNDCYVNNNGNLPTRPSFDKELLTGICKNQSVSTDGFKMLPPSIRKSVNVLNTCTLGITIPEINNSDVILVIRSNEIINGKKFRFNDFKLLVKENQLELWIHV